MLEYLLLIKNNLSDAEKNIMLCMQLHFNIECTNILDKLQYMGSPFPTVYTKWSLVLPYFATTKLTLYIWSTIDPLFFHITDVEQQNVFLFATWVNVNITNSFLCTDSKSVFRFAKWLSWSLWSINSSIMSIYLCNPVSWRAITIVSILDLI